MLAVTVNSLAPGIQYFVFHRAEGPYLKNISRIETRMI